MWCAHTSREQFLFIFMNFYTLLFAVYRRADHIYALINPNRSAIKHHVIILVDTPLSHSKGAIENAALGVLILNTVLYLFLGLSVKRKNSFGFELNISVYKCIQAIVSVTENVVRAATDDDAITLLSYLAYNLDLRNMHLTCK